MQELQQSYVRWKSGCYKDPISRDLIAVAEEKILRCALRSATAVDAVVMIVVVIAVVAVVAVPSLVRLVVLYVLGLLPKMNVMRTALTSSPLFTRLLS